MLCYTIKNSEDRWNAYGRVYLNEDYTESSAGTPNKIADGCGIIFDSSEWSAPNPSDDGVEYTAGYPLEMEHEEYNPNYGPTAKVHHNLASARDCSATMKTTLTKSDTGNDDIPVQFAYEHTYSLSSVAGDVSVSIVYGALKVTIPTGGQSAWDDEVESDKGY